MIWLLSGVYGGIILIALIAFTYWKYRYVIRGGYFKATFIGEVGTFDRTFRVRPNSTEFTIKFKGKSYNHEINTDLKYQTVRWRLPHSFYIVGRREPVDVLKARIYSKTSAEAYHQLGTNTVTRDLFKAFASETLSTSTAFLLLGLVVVGGLAALGWYLDQRIAEIGTALGVQ